MRAADPDVWLTVDEATRFPWEVAKPLVVFLLFVAVLLLGFALLKEITR